VLKCLRQDPKIFELFEPKLQEDFDVFLTAAFRDSFLLSFLRGLGESLVLHASGIHARLKAHDEFMTFLNCCWKSRQLSLLPLTALDCDNETARGLGTTIAGYLGFSGYQREHLKRVWDMVVVMAIYERTSVSSKLIPLIPRQTLVQGLLEQILGSDGKKHYVPLQTYPDELWANHLFVNCASGRGIFSSTISDEFSTDRNICLAYYKHSPSVRKMALPWMSQSLKSDKSFVLECLNFDHLILNHCKKDLLYDFDVLLKVVGFAMRKKVIDGLAENALNGGWDDALVFFARSLHTKIDAYTTIMSFNEQVGAHYFAHAPIVQALIGSYMGIDMNANATERRHELQLVWGNRFVFCLALGRTVAEVCESCNVWTKRKRNSSTLTDEGSDNDSEDDDGDEDG
jgi:hypothetical protein